MPGLPLEWRWWLGMLALAVTLAACETTPPPALSPIQVAKYYGYSEIPLGPDRYQVTYAGPYRRFLRSPAQEAAVPQRTMVYDFALWRAAQLALAQGFTGVRLSNVRSNVNTYADDYYDPFYGPGLYPYGGYPFGPRWGGPYWGPSPYVFQRAEVTVDAQLLKAPAAGDYIAKDVIDQLRLTYPGAEGPPLGGPPLPNQAPPPGASVPLSPPPGASVPLSPPP